MGKVADNYKAGKGAKAKKNPNQIDYLRVAFLEWLIRQTKTSNHHTIWDRFLTEWSTIPEYELPINTHRPGNLHAYVKSMRTVSNVTAARKEIAEVRAKLSEGEGGLKAHQSMLQYYLSSEVDEPAGQKPKKQTKKQSNDEFVEQLKTKTQIAEFVRKRARDDEQSNNQSNSQSDDQSDDESSNKQSINQSNNRSNKRSRPSPDSFSMASNMYSMLGEEEG